MYRLLRNKFNVLYVLILDTLQLIVMIMESVHLEGSLYECLSNFIAAYEESIKPRFPFSICNVFFVSKDNLFLLLLCRLISLPLRGNRVKR